MIGGETFVAWFVGAVGMAYLWVRIFSHAEERVTDITKSRIRRWFAPLHEDSEARPNWAVNFIEIFDQVFGPRFFSLRFVFRSVCATLLFTVMIVAIYIGYGVITQASWSEMVGVAGGKELAITWVCVTLAGNIVADYLSLIETRLILKAIRDRSPIVQLLAVVIDFALTFLIYLLVASMFYSIENLWLHEMPAVEHFQIVFGGDGHLVQVWKLIIERDQLGGLLHADMFRISVITTYFTSAWIWLFVLTGVLGRLMFSLRGGLTRFGRLFNVREHPVTAVGYTLALITLALHITVYSSVTAYGWVTTDPAGVMP